MVWHLIADAGPYTHPLFWWVDTNCEPPSALMFPKGSVGHVQWAPGVVEDLFKLEVRGVEQDLIPYVRQLKLSNNPIKVWIIDPDIHGLLDGPCDVVRLPNHNGEVVCHGMMTCGVGMFINRGRIPEVFLHPFPKGSGRLPSVLLITLVPVKPIPVYHSTFLCDVILVLWGHQEASDGIASLKDDLTSHFTTNDFETFT